MQFVPPAVSERMIRDSSGCSWSLHHWTREPCSLEPLTDTQAGLLSLLDNVAASKDAVTEQKKEKERARIDAAEKRVDAKKPGKKVVERAKALVSRTVCCNPGQ